MFLIYNTQCCVLALSSNATDEEVNIMILQSSFRLRQIQESSMVGTVVFIHDCTNHTPDLVIQLVFRTIFRSMYMQQILTLPLIKVNKLLHEHSWPQMSSMYEWSDILHVAHWVVRQYNTCHRQRGQWPDDWGIVAYITGLCQGQQSNLTIWSWLACQEKIKLICKSLVPLSCYNMSFILFCSLRKIDLTTGA